MRMMAVARRGWAQITLLIEHCAICGHLPGHGTGTATGLELLLQGGHFPEGLGSSRLTTAAAPHRVVVGATSLRPILSLCTSEFSKSITSSLMSAVFSH